MADNQGEVNGRELARLLTEQKKIKAAIDLEKAAYKDWLLKQARHEEHQQYMAEAKAKILDLGVAVDAGAALLWQGELALR